MCIHVTEDVRELEGLFMPKTMCSIYSPMPLVSFLCFEHAVKKERTQNQTGCLLHSTVASQWIRNLFLLQ